MQLYALSILRLLPLRSVRLTTVHGHWAASISKMKMLFLVQRPTVYVCGKHTTLYTLSVIAMQISTAKMGSRQPEPSHALPLQ